MTSLYSIGKKGEIRVFKGEVSFTGPSSPNVAFICTQTGVLGGNLIEKKTAVITGKQGRDANQQAEFELASQINEKMDEGYKTLTILEDRFLQMHKLHPDPTKTIFTEDRYTEEQKVKQCFKALEITFNTNRYWLPLPMLAEKWTEKKKKVKYPVVTQPKLNGVRCIAVWDAIDNKVILVSRGGQKYVMPHLTEEGTDLYNFLKNHPHIQFDGELYKHGMPLQTIAGIVKVEDPVKFERKKVIEYHVYDLAMPNMPQQARTMALQSFKFFSKQTIYVTTWTANSEEEVMKHHDLFVAGGYEGCIVRKLDGLYQFGFRDDALIKVKEFLDAEFEIIGCKVSEGKTVGESFVFILKNNVNDLTFAARPTGTEEEKEFWYKNINDYIGKKATVRYQERTIEGLPHQGHVRSKDTKILMEAIRDYE